MRAISLFAVLLLAVPMVLSGQDRMTEERAVDVLGSRPLTHEHGQALMLVQQLGPRASPELKDAVISAAWAERRANPHGSEVGGDYAYAVAALKDPRTIPFLIEILPNGFFASRVLADFGEEAFDPVLEAASDPEGHEYRVAGSLEALRMMLDDGILSPGRTDHLHAITRERLFGVQANLVVEEAMVLALKFEDHELQERIETLASDRAAVESLMSPFSRDGTPMSLDFFDRNVTKVQDRARLLLSTRTREPM
ncbi:hypothetical protein [Candidatus Palauibacter sp.]|uniref:hypothetical protein n=1 Tax=Candidatus Palauibacter sp. TaxID=3101350 RepID=UPI003B018D33